MSSRGQIQSFDPEEGWGVIDSPDTPGGCWLHFSGWLAGGDTIPRAGSPVWFTFERGRQDGYDFRALGAWPPGTDPVRRDEESDSSAYASSFTFTLLDDDLS